ncbi:hypothetical protein [Nocardia sp. NPDC049526]|uniref:hypothetical protein n=1 Tax=Nocardia sp. NPDC049526 TaxID=3364316 RepID=UPI003790D864
MASDMPHAKRPVSAMLAGPYGHPFHPIRTRSPITTAEPVADIHSRAKLPLLGGYTARITQTRLRCGHNSMDLFAPWRGRSGGVKVRSICRRAAA